MENLSLEKLPIEKLSTEKLSTEKLSTEKLSIEKFFIERLPVVMVCNYLDERNISELAKTYPIPEKFCIRNYRKGEENLWAEIETAAGEFKSEKEALERFKNEFGLYRDDMGKRCFFVINKESNKAIGTTTAWYNNNFNGQHYGRIHWVGIHPDFQGRKLAKPMLATAMMCLAKYHDKAYLTSQTTSYKAINMYLDFGFVPEIMSDECEKAWKIIEDVLDRKILKHDI